MAKKSLKERLKKKKQELKDRTSGGNIIFQKEGSLRVRLLPTGEDNDFVSEVTSFYLGPDIKGVFSPATLGRPCAIMEKYEELKESDDPDDKDLAKTFSPKKRFLAPVLVYTDLKGKKVDEEKSGKLIQLSNNQYQEIIDLYLDSDEWGDMTDPSADGYDIKLTRTGTGQYDTEYSVTPFKNTSAPKGWDKEVDLEKLVNDAIPTYEETQEAISKFLSLGEEDEEEKPISKKKKVSKKKKKSSDLDG